MDKVLLSVGEAADALSIGKTRFYTEILANHLVPTVRIGRRRLVPASAIRELAEKLVNEATRSDAGVSHD